MIPVYNEFFDLTGSHSGAVFLQQLIYWQDKAADQELGCYKTAQELEEETRLSYPQQYQICKRLIDLGVLKKTYRRLQHRMYYKIDFSVLERLIGKTLSDVYGAVKKAVGGLKQAIVGSCKAKKKEAQQGENTVSNTKEESSQFDTSVFAEAESNQSYFSLSTPEARMLAVLKEMQAFSNRTDKGGR